MNVVPKKLPSPPPPSPPARQLDPINMLINETWRWFSPRAGKLIGLTAVMTVVQFLVLVVAILLAAAGAVSTSTPTMNIGLAIGAMVVVMIVAFSFAVLSLWTTVALYHYIIRDDATLSIQATYRQSWKLLWHFATMSLMVGLITFGGLLLFVIPGVYWGLLYSFAPLIVLAEGRQVPALARSKWLVGGHWLDVFWRNLVFSLLLFGISFVISMFFTILFGIFERLYQPFSYLKGFGQYFATLLTTPLSAVYSYQLYRSLRRVKGELSVVLTTMPSAGSVAAPTPSSS